MSFSYEDVLNDEGLFEPSSDSYDNLHLSYAYLLFVQTYTMILYYLFGCLEFGGRKGKERKRNRAPFDIKIGNKLSDRLFRRIYRMRRSSFNKLHDVLKPRLEEIFFPRGGGKRRKNKSRYHIDTKTRLSIALRFFAGADPCDVMQVHDVGLSTVYSTVWGVIDAINSTDALAYHFPNHEQQREIAEGFRARSGAGFSKVIGAIDGLIICIIKPCLKFSRAANCGQTNFRCHRKDKYGLNFQGICDHRLKFIWVEMKWPGATSDFMAWVTSSLCRALEENAITKLIIDGFTFVGDNAYVKKMYMATPLKGMRSGYEDAYNFYLSQLRITIERAFGVFVHRWAILRAPLAIPLPKVAPLVESLVRLHNFCIDESDSVLPSIQSNSLASLTRTVRYSRAVGHDDSDLVHIGADGRPVPLLGHGHHFADSSMERNLEIRGQDNEVTPMDEMIASVRLQKLKRPKY